MIAWKLSWNHVLVCRSQEYDQQIGAYTHHADPPRADAAEEAPEVDAERLRFLVLRN